MNIPSFLFNTISISGEYILDDLVSANLGIGYHYPKGTIFENDNVKPWRANLNGFLLTPEVRFYPAREPDRGFYLGPYYRYSHFSTKWSGKLQRDSISLIDYETHLRLNENGLGIQFGYKFYLSERFTFDIAFGGLRLSWFSLKGSFSGLINEEEILKIIGIDGLDKNGFMGIGQLLFDFIGDNATIRMPFTFPMMRTALSIGITF